MRILSSPGNVPNPIRVYHGCRHIHIALLACRVYKAATLILGLTARECRHVCVPAHNHGPGHDGEEDTILNDLCFGWAVEANLAYIQQQQDSPGTPRTVSDIEPGARSARTEDNPGQAK